jgi:hypothetical protein
MQTTIIYEPGCSLELCGFEAAPACPEPDGDAPVCMRQSDETEIFWMRGEAEGIIRRYEPDGRLTLWYRKPTLANAVTYRGKGGYFKFNTNDTVEARWFGKNYFWPEDAPVEKQYSPYGKVEVAHHCGESGAYRFCSDCPGAPACDYTPSFKANVCDDMDCRECIELQEGVSFENEKWCKNEEKGEGGEEDEILCYNCGSDIRGWDLEDDGYCDLKCWQEYHTGSRYSDW